MFTLTGSSITSPPPFKAETLLITVTPVRVALPVPLSPMPAPPKNELFPLNRLLTMLVELVVER
jgi:hypothetical protein